MRRIYLPLFALLLFACIARPLQASTGQGASQALVNAKLASQSAYIALRSAQLAGGDVSNLANEFNQGLAYLEAAESAETAGNYTSTVTQAQKAIQTFTSIQSQALDLKAQAESQNNLRSIIIILSSMISVALITLGFRFIERWQHRRWLKRLPEMRIIMKEEKHEDA